MLGDAVAQGPHALDGHVRAGELAPLFSLDAGDSVNSLGRLENFFRRETGLRGAGARVGAHRYRTAGEQDYDHPRITAPSVT
jgi:hypothetical protein